MTIEQRWPPLAPPGFVELLVGESGPPPLEDAGSPLGIPCGAQLDLSSLGSMKVVITQNTLIREDAVPLPGQGHLPDISTSRSI